MTDSIAAPPVYTVTDSPHNDDYEARFRRIIDTIAELQWVLEALPAHTEQYNRLQKQLAKETDVLTRLNDKTNSERQALDLLHRTNFKTLSATLSVNNHLRQQRQSHEESYLDAINRTKVQEGSVKEAKQRFTEVKNMLNSLLEKKTILDGCIDQIHRLYEDMFADPAVASANILERMIHSEITELRRVIPETESRLDVVVNARRLLFQAETTMELAMKLLPGAVGFLDAQAKANASRDWMWNLYAARNKAYEAYALAEQAHAVWDVVPVIPHEDWKNGTKINNSIAVTLGSLRGYRLKVEELVKKTVRPYLRNLETELAHQHASLASKLLEWADERARCVEQALRARGELQDVDLEVIRQWLRDQREGSASETGNGRALPGYREPEEMGEEIDELPGYEPRS